MGLYEEIVNNCQLTGSKSTLCDNYSMVHILIIINYYLNKPEKKYFKGIEKVLNIQCFFKHIITRHLIYDGQIYTTDNCYCF